MSPLPTLLFLLPALWTAVPWAAGADPAPAPAANAFEIRDGDRVVFLGDTLLEREGTYGFLETRMAEQFPDRHFTVRNLSWSGDTPLGVSRAMFDPPAKGWERLKEQIAAEKPTVVFSVTAWRQLAADGGFLGRHHDEPRSGTLRTRADERRALQKRAWTIAGCDFRGGERHTRRTALADPAWGPKVFPPGTARSHSHNRLIEAYSTALGEVASERGARFVR